MSESDIIRRLVELRTQVRFVPFVITTADGKRHEVAERLSFAFSTETNQTVAIIPPTGPIDMFRRDSIVSIDVLEPVH